MTTVILLSLPTFLQAPELSIHLHQTLPSVRRRVWPQTNCGIGLEEGLDQTCCNTAIHVEKAVYYTPLSSTLDVQTQILCIKVSPAPFSLNTVVASYSRVFLIANTLPVSLSNQWAFWTFLTLSSVTSSRLTTLW